MDKNIITALKEHMQEMSSRVNLKVRLQEEDQFLQIQLIILMLLPLVGREHKQH